MRLPRPTEGDLEQLFGNLLRAGVIVAAAVVLIGGVLYVLRYGGMRPGYRIFRGEPADLRSVAGIVRDVVAGNRRAVIQFGLLLLIATPIARVAASVVAFALQRDRLYVLVTMAVLAILAYGLLGASI